MNICIRNPKLVDTKNKKKYCKPSPEVQKTQINFKEEVCEVVTRRGVYCKMQNNPDGPYFDVLHHISCAYMGGVLIVLIRRSCTRLNLPFITFHVYKNIYQSSERGALLDNHRICSYCAEKQDGEKLGRGTSL